MKEKEHKKTTLMKYSKDELVDHCMAIEHNNNVLRKNFEQQYINCMQMIDDMNVLNDRLKNMEREREDGYTESDRKNGIHATTNRH